MKKCWLMVGGAAALLGMAAYAQWPDAEPLPEGTQADGVLVLKSERALILLKNGQPLKTYPIALGWHPEGHKQQEGDRKTPEGRYVIDSRNDKTAYHRSLHISYPNAEDKARATANGVDPGGMVMIHGQRRGLGFVGRWHRWLDWTHGCIALTNREVEEIARVVSDGTPIEIRP
jgi:murein L,D-transpeptidase YafK